MSGRRSRQPQARTGLADPDHPVDAAVSTDDQEPAPAIETIPPPEVAPPGDEAAYDDLMAGRQSTKRKDPPLIFPTPSAFSNK